MSKSKLLESGQKFGRLTVIKLDYIKEYISPKGFKQKQKFYLCKCNCGNECVILQNNLQTKRTLSCGCLHLELLKNNFLKHGLANTRLFSIWTNMKTRCYNNNGTDYSNWGGRGITICDEWKNDFKVFYDWAMDNGYKDNLTIDRIDNDGNYEPSNCRWATAREQALNRHNNHLITYNGETHTMKEWSEIIGIDYKTLSNRLNKSKWSINKAMVFE
jgi:hypothetical protein